VTKVASIGSATLYAIGMAHGFAGAAMSTIEEQIL
jgi:hypothetical protein